MTIRLLQSRTLLRRWRMFSCRSAFLHTSEICSVKSILLSIFTPEYFNYFCWRYCCILNIYHPTINITTMGWNQHCLEFYRNSLQRILFKPVHENNNVLCWELSNVINCVTRIRNTVIIGIVVDVTTTIKKEYIFYEEHILFLSITSLRFCHIVSLLKCW